MRFEEFLGQELGADNSFGPLPNKLLLYLQVVLLVQNHK